MDKEVFYWIGVFFSAVCVLGGIGAVVANITAYLYERMKRAYGLMEVKKAWREYKERKEPSQ